MILNSQSLRPTYLTCLYKHLDLSLHHIIRCSVCVPFSLWGFDPKLYNVTSEWSLSDPYIWWFFVEDPILSCRKAAAACESQPLGTNLEALWVLLMCKAPWRSCGQSGLHSMVACCMAQPFAVLLKWNSLLHMVHHMCSLEVSIYICPLKSRIPDFTSKKGC